jgi:hypothetical protein
LFNQFLPLPGLTGLLEGRAFLAGRVAPDLAFRGFAELTLAGFAWLLLAAGTTFTAAAGLSSVLTVCGLSFSGCVFSGTFWPKRWPLAASERNAIKIRYLYMAKMVHYMNTGWLMMVSR